MILCNGLIISANRLQPAISGGTYHVDGPGCLRIEPAFIFSSSETVQVCWTEVATRREIHAVHGVSRDTVVVFIAFPSGRDRGNWELRLTRRGEQLFGATVRL